MYAGPLKYGTGSGGVAKHEAAVIFREGGLCGGAHALLEQSQSQRLQRRVYGAQFVNEWKEHKEQKEIEHIAEAAAQEADAFEEDRNRRNKRHDRHGDEQEGRQQGQQVEMGVLSGQELNTDARNSQHKDHGHQHGKVTGPFAESIKGSCERRGRHDLPHARFTVACHRAFDQVKPEPTQKEGTDQRHHAADPGGIELPAVDVEPQRDVANRNLIAKEGAQPQHDQETVTAHAF